MQTETQAPDILEACRACSHELQKLTPRLCEPFFSRVEAYVEHARLAIAAEERRRAAEPDLLAVVQRLLCEDEAGEYTIGLIEDARAAIAKAS